MTEEYTQLLKFPCDFPIKVFGFANDEFETTVYSIVREHTTKLAENAVQMRYSKDKKYLSLTITVAATSQAQLDGIYRALTSNKAVLMAL